MFEVVVVGIAAFLTSILSAVAGLGGGVILLLVIAQFVAPTVAIPIQGSIQLVSNGSRAALLRHQISWPVVGWVSILLFPASLIGVAVATSLPDDVVRLVLAGVRSGACVAAGHAASVGAQVADRERTLRPCWPA